MRMFIIAMASEHAVYMSETDSDSEEEEILLLSILLCIPNKNPRRWWVHETLKLREALGEYHNLVQELQDDEERFHDYFRMSPAVFDELLVMIKEDIAVQSTNVRLSGLESGSLYASGNI